MKTDTVWVVNDGGFWDIKIRTSKYNSWIFVGTIKDYKFALKVAQLAKEYWYV